MTTAERATPAESSKLLKSALRKAFPGVNFSVRLSTGTGYGNCYVDWTDGPSREEVATVTDQFEGEGFDGMTDSSYSKDRMLPDGRRTGLRLICCQRTRSTDRLVRI